MRYAYQQMTNTGHWATLSQHETSGAAQALLGFTTSTPERVIERAKLANDLPRLIVCRDPRGF